MAYLCGVKKKNRHHKSAKRIFVTTLVILTIIAIAGVAYVWRSGVIPTMRIDPEEYPVMGIDLSAHNGKVDFEAVYADSVSFVYLKATEGASFHDSAFEHNYTAAKAVEGLAVGAYHFFRFDVNGTLQARNFLSAVEGKSFDMPLAIDVEEHGNPDTSTDVIVKRLQEMINCLESEGIQPIIYTNLDGYHRIYKDNFNDYPLWISRFTKPDEDIDWSIWQFSHWGDVAGTNGEVDLNVFSGKRTDFHLWTAE